MSRQVKLDFNFDVAKFSDLLRKAQGNRQQKVFAEQIGMNKSYLNCYLTGNVDHPLTPSTLLKIALVAENSVSLEELLTASGYNPDNFIWNDKLIKRATQKDILLSENHKQRFFNGDQYNPNKPNKEAIKVSQNINAISGTITNALAEHGYKWSGKDKNIKENTAVLDLLISLYEQPVQNWGFIYLVEKNQFRWSNGNKTINELSPAILLSMEKTEDKLSFVTTDEEIFEYYSKQSIPVLSIYMSVILVDPAQMKVIKEVVIPTSCKDDDSIPKLI